jgi:thymidylate kinase
MNSGVSPAMAPDQARAKTFVPRPFLITFSGIDGAGKTTQIEYLTSFLEKQGLRVLLLSFWDNVAAWSKMRGGVGQRTVDSTEVDRTNERPFIPRNNKHIRNWYLTAARAGFYMLDIVRLHRLLASHEISNYDVVIFDRYIYDQIANIYSASWFARLYGKILLEQTPAPDLAFIIDASPAAAFARKPEYPLEFVYLNRQNFLHLQELVPQLIVISSGMPEDVRNEICRYVSRSWDLKPASTQGNTEDALVSPVVRRQTSCSVQNDPTTSL